LLGLTDDGLKTFLFLFLNPSIVNYLLRSKESSSSSGISGKSEKLSE